MAGVQEYKCPNCGGTLTFDSDIQKMKCPYCDSEIDVESLKKYDEDLNKTNKEDEIHWNEPGNEWQEGETDGMRVYVCNSCGGQIVGDETLGATACPFCGNPVVLMGQFKGDLKPDFVIPFKLDKEAAKEAYKNHLKGKPLLPKVFAAQNHIDEIKGMYVPFWLFDADTEGGVNYNAQRVRMWSDSKFQYTETEHFAVYRQGSVSFYKVPVDGSENMPDELMESIEPFDFSQAVDFQTAYLSGYLANRYDVDAEQSVDRANQRIRRSLEEALQSTVKGYTSVTVQDSQINVHNGKAKYALYPVWIMNTTWNDKHYLFAMNGETGKFVGDLPIDNTKLWIFRILFFIVPAVIVFLILFFVF